VRHQTVFLPLSKVVIIRPVVMPISLIGINHVFIILVGGESMHALACEDLVYLNVKERPAIMDPNQLE
jgi:hypothetical protein